MREHTTFQTNDNNGQLLTTNKTKCLENLHLDTNVEGWALWFCLSPLWASL
jgi:hypothetical protein